MSRRFEEVGVQLFEILPDGCLNGSYINLDTGKVFNEIAKKIDSIKGVGKPSPVVSDWREEFTGTYICSYANQERGAAVNMVTGTITINSTRGGLDDCLDLVWNENGHTTIDWVGKGWRIKENLIIVKYQKP